MAVRVFIPSPISPDGIMTVYVNFAFNSGFSKTQKQKNVAAIHYAFANSPFGKGKKIIEISSKSTVPEGVQLSAFNLKMEVPEIGPTPVECVFQGGKAFANGGPYTDLYLASPKEAKRDARLRESGKLVSFRFDGKDFPLEPKTGFYDYLYITALLQNPELAEFVAQYDAFTDVEFIPKKSINCQAKACALYKSLLIRGGEDAVRKYLEEREKTASE